MKINFEQLKTLVEAGDEKAFSNHIFGALEKGDLLAAVTVNTEVKSEFDSEKDKHQSTALETWKENNLQGLIDAAVSKANPTETPEQKRIRELEEKIEENERKEKVAAMKEKALEHVSKNGLNLKFASKYVDRFLGDDETVTASALDELKTDLDAIVSEQVEAKFKANGRDINTGTGGTGGTIKSIQEMAAAHNIRNQQ